MTTTTAQMKERPEELPGTTIKAVCGCGSIYVTINTFEGVPFEIFVRSGKNGTCTNTTLGAIGFIFSDMLQNGVPLDVYTKRLIGFECERRISRVEGKGTAVFSCIDAIAKTINEYLKSRSSAPAVGPAGKGIAGDTSVSFPTPPTEKSAIEAEEPNDRDMRGKRCWDCGGQVIHEGGCDRCLSCGRSENCD